MSPSTPSRSTSARRTGLRVVVAGGAFALVGGLLGPTLAMASPVPDPKAPNKAAAKAGVQRGNATMGWRDGVQRTDLARVAGDSRITATSKVTRAGKLVSMTGVLGIDVSSYQGVVDWASFTKVKRSFAYVKATEGSSYRNPYYASQYGGAKTAGMFAGAYHFANPSGKSGKTQATYFAKYGGAWRNDGKTLPGVLDIEYNPYGGNMCYGLSKTKMVAWITDFLTTYKKLTTRDGSSTPLPTGGPSAPATLPSSATPTRSGRPGGTPKTGAGKLPGGWPNDTFWQYSATVIDQNRFSNTAARLKVLATNGK